MALLDVIEVLTESDKSWEDAAQNAITTASKTVRNIKSIYIRTAILNVGSVIGIDHCKFR